jgi:5-formyltetrahydrofolate cyclo-ligase
MTDDRRQALRENLRRTRRDLSQDQQTIASQDLFAAVRGLDIFTNARRLAFYKPMDGEIDPSMIIDLALAEGKSCFLPVIADTNPEFISFAPFNKETQLHKGKWGIAEPPLPETPVPATDFDVVFVPLVAFDKNCFRLGMGKGFYDRTFSFKIFNRQARPLLIGLAHECQLTEPFEVHSWDVRLDAVVTAVKIYRPDTA